MKYNPIVQRFVVCFFILGILASCGQYSTLPYSESSGSSIENLVLDNDGYIKSDRVLVHSNGKTYRISEAIVKKNEVTGKLSLLEVNQEIDYISSYSNDYEFSDKDETEQYSHFYDISNSLEEGDELKISVDNKTGEVSLYQKSGNGWKVLRNVLLVIAGLFAGLVIFLLIACNCPHAYTFDGQKYHFTNSLFTGATAANLERDDFKILEDYQLDSDTYEMIIKNEENESHFINQLELMVISHAENIEVAPNQNGQIYSISKLVNAENIVSDNGVDLSKMLSKRDEVAYSFDSESEESMVNIYATFKKPEDVSNAKVVVKLKNSEWGGVVYKTFASLMGDKYEKWVDKNHKRSSEEAVEGMKEAGVPLTVSIKKGDNWIDIESFNLVGEVSYNTLVAEIDENLITGDEIELRVQAGFKIWDLDYLGMDFSQDDEFEMNVIAPKLMNHNESTLEAISRNDNLYLEHLNEGDSTYFRFEGLSTVADRRTIILHSKGYYISHDEYTGSPSWGKLMKLRSPGGLSRLSKEIYDAYSNLVLEPD